MKKLGILIGCLLISFASMAGEGDSKTFLFLFKQKELKALKLSLKDLESQFAAFKTKSYGGNSELALFIETPDGNFDACFIGQFLIRNEKKVNIKLEDIAFRMIDLSETQELKNQLLLAHEESLQKKKGDKNAQKP
ncbi:hypothetical protein ACFOSV_10825 [Algoriphagus namhaensis]|uniref:DUF4252 domain-containing protein n=1 Tax=Algoriphagus namhaensis TaxID=915353 RepID=A0ABV8ASV0_9BACT